VLKSLGMLLVVVSASMLFVSSGLVSALDASEASATVTWSNSAFYGGDIIGAQVSFQSSQELTIYYVGIHFDWMPADGFYGVNLNSTPGYVSSSNSILSESFSVQIPTNVTEGPHTYSVGVEGVDASSNSFSWNSPTSTIQVGPAEEKLYNILLTQVESQMNSANKTSYQNSSAKSYLQQAQAAYDLAPSQANAGNWTQALITLQDSSTYLDLASAAEQKGAISGQGVALYLIAISVAIIIIAAFIAVLFVRKRKQNKMLDVPPPPSE
jgi:hypothetical protein